MKKGNILFEISFDCGIQVFLSDDQKYLTFESLCSPDFVSDSDGLALDSQAFWKEKESFFLSLRKIESEAYRVCDQTGFGPKNFVCIVEGALKEAKNFENILGD